MQDNPLTSKTPPTHVSPETSGTLTPTELIQQWPAHVGLEDIRALELLLDEALIHLDNALQRLSVPSDDAIRDARVFLAQFQQP